MRITCTFCKKSFVYDRSKGHRKTRCSSCFQKNKRAGRKLKCLEYKGNKCQMCGYSKCNRALSFHHRDPKKKAFTISKFCTVSWTKLKKELDKCDLLCSNCHMEQEDIGV